MKSRLNITIDGALIEQAKRYADRRKISLSKLVETYLRSLIRPSRKENILDYMKKLPKSKTNLPGDLKSSYYESRKKKYGF